VEYLWIQVSAYVFTSVTELKQLLKGLNEDDRIIIRVSEDLLTVTVTDDSYATERRFLVVK